MSFVREIVESNSLVTMDELVNELPKLREDSQKLRNSTLNYIEKVFVKFTNRPEAVHFFHEAGKLITKAQEIHNAVDDVVMLKLDKAKTEIAECKEQLRHIDENLNISNEIGKRYEELLLLQNYMDKKSYIKASEIVNDLSTVDVTKYCEIMQVIKEQYAFKRQDFLYSLCAIINENIQYSSNQKDAIITNTLTIKPKNEDMEQAVFAISTTQDSFPLNDLNVFISKTFLFIIQYATIIEISSGELILKVNKHHKESYSNVAVNLVHFSDFLSTNLDYSMSGNKCVMDYVREDFDELAQLIIKHCLVDTIPSTEEELKNYEEVQKRTEVLQCALIERKILDPQSTSLIDFVSEINVHFVNKKCQEYNKLAIDLIKKDLHNTTTVGHEYNPNDLSFDGFLQCAISSSVLELLDLIQIIIQKAIECPDGSAGYYVVTATTILDKYKSAVELHHQRLLMTIPQQIAIFYNNCKFLANELISRKWDALLKRLPSGLHDFGGFTQVTLHLNDSAVKMLDKYIKEQVDTIKTRIAESGIHLACEKLEPSVEKVIRQCLRQQELLKTVWQKVLNYYDYNKTMGILLDSLCKVTIMEILRISDIPTEVADQLVDILKVILTRGPKLFTEPKEIHMYVMNWDKLSELLFVLNTGLELIGQRWADGKGPLALHFTGDEMRNLIRALFQNSDKRANLLAKIN